MIKPAFIDGVEKKARRKASTGGGAGTLIIRARLTKLDPGSQAARPWAGFGAGAVKIAIAGEIVDGSTQKTLLRLFRNGVLRSEPSVVGTAHYSNEQPVSWAATSRASLTLSECLSAEPGWKHRSRPPDAQEGWSRVREGRRV